VLEVTAVRFAGKNAIVTGGASGIGAATARRLASEGAHVVVADFNETSAEAVAAEVGGTAIRCDVTSREDVEAVVARTAERGSVDIVVTCAGIIRDNLLFKMTDDDWESVIDAHLKRAFFTVRAAQSHMVEQRSGKIVLISSTGRSATVDRRTTHRRRLVCKVWPRRSRSSSGHSGSTSIRLHRGSSRRR
jgi:3-oxoacyl-[acyl-carrier protein] reductase